MHNQHSSATNLGSKILEGWKTTKKTSEGPFRYWLNIKRSAVVEEIVTLAAKHTNSEVQYRDQPGELSDMDMPDAAEAHDNGYNANRLKATHGSLWICDFSKDMGPFWAELERLEGLIVKPLDEPIMNDDEPVHQGYRYVANGRPVMFIDGMNMTVGRWKKVRVEGVPVVTEVRRYDMAGRHLRLPEKNRLVQSNFALDNGDTKVPNRQKSRRPRSSNKIKKVK